MTARIPALLALSAVATFTTFISFDAQAHEGHGMPGVSHWHAGDASLWLVGAALAVGLWLARRGR
jgi:hypothetical protein